MKHLYCFFSVFLLVFAFSCNQIIQEDITTLSDSLATRSEEASEITTDTTHFMASSFNPSLKVRLRQHFGEKQFTKQTVSRDDAPLLQVLNFEGGGWAIVDARNEDADLILAYDDGGCFDAENITSPEVAFWFYLLQDQLACEKETSNKSEEQGPEEPLRSWPIDYSLDYYWVRLPVGPVIVTQETANIPHLTQTKWGQGVPWNRFCYYQGTHFVTGCAPVAVSQMLYYLHYHIGFPSGLYHTIIPTFTAYPTYENGILTDCYWRITHIDRDDITSPLHDGTIWLLTKVTGATRQGRIM